MKQQPRNTEAWEWQENGAQSFMVRDPEGQTVEGCLAGRMTQSSKSEKQETHCPHPYP